MAYEDTIPQLYIVISRSHEGEGPPISVLETHSRTEAQSTCDRLAKQFPNVLYHVGTWGRK